MIWACAEHHFLASNRAKFSRDAAWHFVRPDMSQRLRGKLHASAHVTCRWPHNDCLLICSMMWFDVWVNVYHHTCLLIPHDVHQTKILCPCMHWKRWTMQDSLLHIASFDRHHTFANQRWHCCSFSRFQAGTRQCHACTSSRSRCCGLYGIRSGCAL